MIKITAILDGHEFHWSYNDIAYAINDLRNIKQQCPDALIEWWCDYEGDNEELWNAGL